MGAFDFELYSSEERHSGWQAAIAALFAAAVAAWFVSSPPVTRSLSIVSLVVSSAQQAVIVLLVSGATAWLLSRKHSRAVRRRALITSLSSLWLVPLVLLIREHSAWALLPTTIFVASATYSLCLLSPRQRENPSSNQPFGLLASSNWSWRQPAAIGAALAAQVGTLLSLGGYIVSGALLVAASIVVWASSYARAAPPIDASWHSDHRTTLIVATAILCTFAALLPYLRVSFALGGGFGLSSRDSSRRRVPLRRVRQEGTEPPSGDSAAGPSDGHSGIILWAPEQTRTMLVAPPPITATNRFSTARGTDPLVIPFDGVYWFFKSPDSHPPRTSQQAHGTPEQFDIRSTDWRPLLMEAHENLGTLIDLDCCSRIEIAIHNRDRYPETVSLELVLIDSTLPEKPSQSLGRALVRSTRPWRIYDKPSPAHETLDFAIPTRHTLRRFDEVMIRFCLDHARSDSGAKIAIDRFVLIPRGL